MASSFCRFRKLFLLPCFIWENVRLRKYSTPFLVFSFHKSKPKLIYFWHILAGTVPFLLVSLDHNHLHSLVEEDLFYTLQPLFYRLSLFPGSDILHSFVPLVQTVTCHTTSTEWKHRHFPSIPNVRRKFNSAFSKKFCFVEQATSSTDCFPGAYNLNLFKRQLLSILLIYYVLFCSYHITTLL